MSLQESHSIKIHKTHSTEVNSVNQLNRSYKFINSMKKVPDEPKGFVFSLSQFDKNKAPKVSSPKIQINSDKSFDEELRKSTDSQKQNKRKMIYGNESYKQKYEEGFEEAVTNNNNLFSMVFLNKDKNKSSKQVKLEPDPQEQPSFSKNYQKQTVEQEEPQMKIQDFDMGKKLGAGKFGQVFLARHKKTNFVCAIKKIDKSQVSSKLIVQLVRQIKIQSFLNHPNVVKMYNFFADKNYIYLMLELCYSGQLYDFLRKKRKIPQDMTRNIVQQICRALDYMHENEIIHRDLKPENAIYHGGLIKLCDFGWSISTNTMRGTFCGTPLYVSPELLKRKTYNNKIDVWSIGVLTYELLFGKVPFEITTEQDFIKIIEDQIRFSKITKVSDDAKDFIMACLEKDPRDRYTLPELMEHPFIAKVDNISMAEMY